MSIGSRTREARKRAKMTQGALASRVGMKQSSLSELETGASNGTTMIASIASTLGVSALWLETGKGPMVLSSADGHTEGLKLARMVLAYDDESGLLDLFRRTDDRGRYEITKLAISESKRVIDADSSSK